MSTWRWQEGWGARAAFEALMKKLLLLSAALPCLALGETKRLDVPYVEGGHERQKLDVLAPEGADTLPVLFWIHGGGWVTGDKSSVQEKPRAFLDKGFVFVSTNYRLLPDFPMEDIVGDVARALGWVRRNIGAHGGDPERIVVGGHSAGAQLAALICADDSLLKAEGVPLSSIKACIPVDGDTFDIPAIIETAETRRRVHQLPQATFGHREKFGNDPAKHANFSTVNHVAPGKGIPPYFILHVSSHPDTSAQAQRLAAVLKENGIEAVAHGVRETTHGKINADIGLPDDPATAALWQFLEKALEGKP
jgi:arylformamidase